MGQRLVVTVQQDNEIIAGIYYHWSAYSVSALKETREILNCLLDEENPITDLKLRLIRFVEQNGGCIDGGGGSDEYNEISKIYPDEKFATHGSRNDGLIALTEEGINDLEGWSEGDVVIDLDNEQIHNTVFFCETLEEWDEDSYGESLEDIQEMEIDIEDFPFEDLDMMIETLEDDVYQFRKENLIYELIS